MKDPEPFRESLRQQKSQRCKDTLMDLMAFLCLEQRIG
jgi:hypothetical protein